MSHRLTFFTLPTARAVPLLCWVVVVCVGCLCLVLCFACAAGIFLIIMRMYPDDRQCLIARSAVPKKKPVNRMLLKPPLIALADGFDNGWAPTGREPHVQGVHQAHRSKPVIELGQGTALLQRFTLS